MVVPERAMYEAQHEHKMSRHFDNAFSSESRQIKTLTTTKRSLLPQQLSLSENMRRPYDGSETGSRDTKNFGDYRETARAAKSLKRR